MLIWSNFDGFAVTYLIQEDCFQKLNFPVEVVLNS